MLPGGVATRLEMTCPHSANGNQGQVMVMFSRDFIGLLLESAADFLVRRIGKRWSAVVLVFALAVLIAVLCLLVLPVFA